MKTIISLLIAIALPISAAGDNQAKAQSPTTDEAILNELKEIRKIQEEEMTHRQKSIKKWQETDVQNNHMEESSSTDVVVMAQIEGNTRRDPIKDGWNLYGWIAFGIAAVSMIFAIWTLREQKKTERNTKNLSREAQRHLLNELLRHIYRNYVITYAMKTKMEGINYKGYPSEEHFMKLKIPMENIHLESFYGEDENFRRMHVLYLNLRNYNEEVEVAMNHMSNPAISIESKEEDFDTLLFKVSFLTEKICNTIFDIWDSPKKKEEKEAKEKKEKKKDEKKELVNSKRREKLVNDMKVALRLSLSGETNATDNIDVPGSGDFVKIPFEKFKETSYSLIYTTEEEMRKVYDIFIQDVTEERKKNNREAWKIRIIKF